MFSAICRNLSSLFFSIILCRSNSSLAAFISLRLGRLNACGINLTRKIAVGTDARAVSALTPPETQYHGTHSVHTSSRCVATHAAMNTPKHTNIQLNGRSFLFRTNWISAIGIAKYASAIRPSEIACSQMSSGSHSWQNPCGITPCVENHSLVGFMALLHRVLALRPAEREAGRSRRINGCSKESALESESR